MNTEPRKRSQGLALMLYFLIIVYLVGALFMFVGWLGLQTLDTQAWDQDRLPVYVVIALLGAASAYAVLKWKRLGVYGLAGVWVANGITNLIFVRPIPYGSLLAGVIVVIAFFLLLLPAWKHME